MEPRREAQVLLQENSEAEVGKAWQAKHPWVCRGSGVRTELQDARRVPLARQGRIPVSQLSGTKPGGIWPLPSPSKPLPRAEEATLDATLGYSFSAGSHSLLAKDWNGVEGPGLGSLALAVPASVTVPGRLLRTGLQSHLEVGLAAGLQSSSSACSLPMGVAKTVHHHPLQCSPRGIMAEQSWGHRSSSPVWDDGPHPGCSVGAPHQAPAISTPEPPGTPGPRRNRSDIDPGEKGNLESWPPSRERETRMTF